MKAQYREYYRKTAGKRRERYRENPEKQRAYTRERNRKYLDIRVAWNLNRSLEKIEKSTPRECARGKVTSTLLEEILKEEVRGRVLNYLKNDNMKKLINQIFLYLCIAAFCASCDNDGDMIYVDGMAPSELIATASEVKLDVSQRAKVVLQLAWKNPTLLSSDANNPVTDNLLKTYVEASASEDFQNAASTAVTSLSKAYTGTELNTLAKTLGINVNTAGVVYFRIKSTQGDNMAAQYSNVCKVTVTPYYVDMTRLAVLASNKTDTIAYLHSPEADGVYTGYMNATPWLNCWFYEYSGDTWGNYSVDGHAFEISNASDAWNCWFADGSGAWLVKVDTKEMEWSATLLSQLRANGNDMTYYSKRQQWGYYITTTADNQTVSIEADAKQYDKSTRTDASIDKTLHFTAQDGKLVQADAASISLRLARTPSS